MNKNILVFVISLPLLLLADEDQEINSFLIDDVNKISTMREYKKINN